MLFPIGKLLALLGAFLGIGGQGIAVIATIFWAWVLIDCLTKEPAESNDKVAWVLVILLVPVLGALAYYFVRRPERVKAVGQ
ncbi:MAG TPA: PLDc N-terminal domain-containing protein [Ktedonosporobacter sp.]|nr:PLDc N-terminal domain-containing protein [Ktedonosporobacter sp.]